MHVPEQLVQPLIQVSQQFPLQPLRQPLLQVPTHPFLQAAVHKPVQSLQVAAGDIAYSLLFRIILALDGDTLSSSGPFALSIIFGS